MSEEEVDFLYCENCDSPCYTFSIDEKRGLILSAFCQVCGNEDTKQFRRPDDEDDTGA